jgi:hypothetical protein
MYHNSTSSVRVDLLSFSSMFILYTYRHYLDSTLLVSTHLYKLVDHTQCIYGPSFSKKIPSAIRLKSQAILSEVQTHWSSLQDF